MGISRAQNAKNQQKYRERMKEAGLVLVRVYRPAGTEKEFKQEWDMSKTVPDLRKKNAPA